MKKMGNKGFTLVELLVTLAVISMVLSITVYAVNNAIRKGKEKTYLTTINEIEKAIFNNDYEVGIIPKPSDSPTNLANKRDYPITKLTKYLIIRQEKCIRRLFVRQEKCIIAAIIRQ